MTQSEIKTNKQHVYNELIFLKFFYCGSFTLYISSSSFKSCAKLLLLV